MLCKSTYKLSTTMGYQSVQHLPDSRLATRSDAPNARPRRCRAGFGLLLLVCGILKAIAIQVLFQLLGETLRWSDCGS